MTIRTIGSKESLDSVWEDLVYTEARLMADSNASDLAPLLSAPLERIEQVRLHQRQAWRAEIIAQAKVDDADDDLDDAVSKTDRALLRVVDMDRSHARYKRYFNRAPSAVIRMGLQSELEVVRGWPASLATEEADELKKVGHELTAAITSGDSALEERRKAASARTDQRVREILSFIDDTNRLRLSIYGELVRRGVDKNLPKGWPSRFFQASKHGDKAEAPTGGSPSDGSG